MLLPKPIAIVYVSDRHVVMYDCPGPHHDMVMPILCGRQFPEKRITEWASSVLLNQSHMFHMCFRWHITREQEAKQTTLTKIEVESSMME